MKDLPAFVRPPPVLSVASSGLVVRWINTCIEFDNGSIIPSKEYLKSFQEWCDYGYSLRNLNKVLRDLGFYVGKVVRVNGASHRCWVNVRLKEDGGKLIV